jgi:hypothetical protein
MRMQLLELLRYCTTSSVVIQWYSTHIAIITLHAYTDRNMSITMSISS